MRYFSQILKEARKNARRKLKEVADATGLSISHISDMEHGRKNAPPVDVIRKLESFLGLPKNKLWTAAQSDLSDSYELKERISKRPELSLGFLRMTEGMSDDELAEVIHLIKMKREETAGDEKQHHST